MNFKQTPQEEYSKQNFFICQWCGQPSVIIWVHGHGQCSICGTNIDECCRGEQCYFETSDSQNFRTEKNQ